MELGKELRSDREMAAAVAVPATRVERALEQMFFECASYRRPVVMKRDQRFGELGIPHVVKERSEQRALVAFRVDAAEHAGPLAKLGRKRKVIEALEKRLTCRRLRRTLLAR